MKKFIKIFLLFLIITSCESIVDVDLPAGKPLIVVNSFFTPDSVFKVHLSKSLGILSDENRVTGEYGYPETVVPIIENAKVELWNDEKFITNLIYDKAGIYIAPNIYPEQNKNYKIIVNVEGFASVTASNIIPSPILITDVKSKKTTQNEYSSDTELTITFKDNLDEENFYEMYIVNSYRNYKYLVYFESDDILIKENSILDEIDGGFYQTNIALFDDTIISGKEYNLKVTYFDYDVLADFYVVLSTISKDKYQYLKSINEQRKYKDNPFAEPVFIHNNIENGLGIFAGYSSSIYKIQ